MATKPSTVPLWNTGGANNTAPSAPKIVLGWVFGEQPPSSYFNNRLKLLGEWAAYLSDGAFTGAASFANAVTMASTLGVTGLSTLASLAVSGVASVAGLLTTAAITASGLITANAGVTAGANQHVTVSGTGAFKHGDVVLQLSPHLASLGTNISSAAVDYIESVGLGTALLGVPLKVGDRIKSVTFGSSGNTSADVTVTVYKTNALGVAVTSIGTVTLTNPTSTPALTTIDVTDTTLAANEAIVVRFDPNAAGIIIGTVQATYDRP